MISRSGILSDCFPFYVSESRISCFRMGNISNSEMSSNTFCLFFNLESHSEMKNSYKNVKIDHRVGFSHQPFFVLK
jgi:hypothetical protein